ncbi:MAG: hypothetical protein NC453_24695 [Muribaculum sp.]|nr:hypothetical protein [Muribaculum sp.]
MYQTVLFKVPGRPNNKPVVILSGLNARRQCSTYHFRDLTKMLSRALSTVWNWVKCNCTPVQILRFIFCEKVSMAVGAVLVLVMWWHIASIADNIAAGEQVATDCLYAMPWGIVWAIRASRMPLPEEDEEGGEA